MHFNVVSGDEHVRSLCGLKIKQIRFVLLRAFWSYIHILEVRSFLQVFLTPTHLAIVLEYAAGGELFERICNAGRLSEDEVGCVCVISLYLYKLSSDDFYEFPILQARFFFQQLISGVSYCHSMVHMHSEFCCCC